MDDVKDVFELGIENFQIIENDGKKYIIAVTSKGLHCGLIRFDQNVMTIKSFAEVKVQF